MHYRIVRDVVGFIILLLVCFFVFPANALSHYDPDSVDNNIYGIGIVNFQDLEDAADLVNSNGGDWGYTTIVMPTENLNKEQWQAFFDKCRFLHVIPIVRIATGSEGGNWKKPDIENIDNIVNFLNSLNWVVENRYIIIGNEPNHAKEWGGDISPSEYGLYLKTFSSRLRNSNSDYFVLPAAFDQSAPNSKDTMDEEKYIKMMLEEYPDFFEYIDGWNSHSYPNPGFSGSHFDTGRSSIVGYKWELSFIRSFGINKKLPVFISETGWVNDGKDEDENAGSFVYAFENIWGKDKDIIAVTPFVLNYTEKPFEEFSWKKDDGSYSKQYERIRQVGKIKGTPKQKVSGEVKRSQLRSVGKVGTWTDGEIYIVNTGQNIWEKGSLQLKHQGIVNTPISSSPFNTIMPFTYSYINYSLQFPDEEGEFYTKISLYADETKIGDAFEGVLYVYKGDKGFFKNAWDRILIALKQLQNFRS